MQRPRQTIVLLITIVSIGLLLSFVYYLSNENGNSRINRLAEDEKSIDDTSEKSMEAVQAEPQPLSLYGVCAVPLNECSLNVDFLTQMLLSYSVQNKSGNERFCPCCGGQFQQPFIPLRGRSDALCPRCNSLERQRAVCLLLPQLAIHRVKILLFAPRQMKGVIEKYRDRSIELITTDINEKGVDVQADIQHLPFANNTFDLILNSHVMEHIPNDLLGFQEQYRVMKAGAIALFQAPIRFNRKKTIERHEATAEEVKKWQADHVRDYGSDFLERAAAGGLECTVIAIESTLSHIPPQVNTLLMQLMSVKGEKMVLCRKCKQQDS